MTRVIYRRTQAQLDSVLHANGITDDTLREGKMIVGAANEVIDQISARVEAGVERIMLQWMDLDDMENLELLARDVLPQFAPVSPSRFRRKRSPKRRGDQAFEGSIMYRRCLTLRRRLECEGNARCL